MSSSNQPIAAQSVMDLEEIHTFTPSIQAHAWDPTPLVNWALEHDGQFGDQVVTDVGPPLNGKVSSLPRRAPIKASSLVNLPTYVRPALSATMSAVQEWEGYVLAIREREFDARLTDLTAGNTFETEEATIPLEELSDLEAKKISVGSIFRWVIGYERSPAGTKKRVSLIVFFDLPATSKSDLIDGDAWARRVAHSLEL